jgi:hypothetical protein
MLLASVAVFCPGLMRDGRRMKSGMCNDSSCGLPLRSSPCEPCISPCSAEKTTSVLSARPISASPRRRRLVCAASVSQRPLQPASSCWSAEASRSFFGTLNPSSRKTSFLAATPKSDFGRDRKKQALFFRSPHPKTSFGPESKKQALFLGSNGIFANGGGLESDRLRAGLSRLLCGGNRESLNSFVHFSFEFRMQA